MKVFKNLCYLVQLNNTSIIRSYFYINESDPILMARTSIEDKTGQRASGYAFGVDSNSFSNCVQDVDCGHEGEGVSSSTPPTRNMAVTLPYNLKLLADSSLWPLSCAQDAKCSVHCLALLLLLSVVPLK